MTSISELFFSTNQENSTLHRRITPSEEQKKLQQERWNDLIDFLKVKLQERSDCEIESWLQGSYKFGTQIRPHVFGGEFDIDLGVYFNWNTEIEGEKHSNHDLKSYVQNSLTAYAENLGTEEGATVLVPAKNKCARITFLDNFHIDVPAYHQDTNSDIRRLATEDNGWENSDPKAIYEWFKNEVPDDAKRFVLRRIIRYLKMWSALNLEKANRPSTIMLTVLTVKAYKQSETDTGDDFILFECAKHIKDQLHSNSVVSNPVDSTENLNTLENRISIFIEELDRFIAIAERATSCTSSFEAACTWQEAFKYFFPLPDIDESSEITKALVPVKFVPQVAIRAKSQTNSHYEHSWKNEVTSVPRDCTLYFTITNTDELPANAKIEWYARNEGEEAEYVNDLGHFAGNKTAIEDSSAYHGTHYMDVTIKSAIGEILGFRRIPVHIEPTPIPARNPTNKPSYTLLRRRKRK